MAAPCCEGSRSLPRPWCLRGVHPLLTTTPPKCSRPIPTHPPVRTNGRMRVRFQVEHKCLMQWAKNLGECGSHSIRRQASDQKRAGKAQHQHQIRAGSQHRQERVTPQAVFRQGLFGKLRGQCSVLLLTAQAKVRPGSGCYPVRSGCYSGLPLFKTSLPASQREHPKTPPLTLGENSGSRRDSQSGRGPARKRLR